MKNLSDKFLWKIQILLTKQIQIMNNNNLRIMENNKRLQQLHRQVANTDLKLIIHSVTANHVLLIVQQ